MKDIKEFLNSITKGDCITVMNELPDNSIDLTVTSPPYDNLRDYKGYSFKFEEIAKQLLRITKPGGVVVWVVKDAVINCNRTLTSYKQAIHFQEIGFNIYDVIIYSKTTASLPHSNRYHDTFEYMFVLSKGTPKTVNLLNDRKNKYGRTKTWGSRSAREKDGTLTDKGVKKVKEYGIRFNIWEYATGYGNTTEDEIAYQHPAMFPESLAKDHILSWSNVDDVVLDPMCGSGTTCKMARLHRRNYIGIDISEEYCKIARTRVENIPNRLDNFGEV